jgi:preprotein translocase subunit SecA
VLALRSLIDRHDDYEAAVEAERARAVIDAVRTIYRDGRQVLYLTAQADEVQKWNAALDGDATIEHEVVPLRKGR